MTDPRGLQDLWLRAVDLNVRYYSGLSKLTAEYLKDLTVMMSASQAAASQGSTSTSASGARTAANPEGSKSTDAPGIIVLEGEAGSTAIGVFLVGNSFPVDVSAPIKASSVLDEDGHEGHVTFAFDPAVLKLKPGEQMLVRVSTVIDPGLEAGAGYRGEFSIPELGATRIPVIVRRRLTASKEKV